MPLALQRGGYFTRRKDSSCSAPSETASATIVTATLWVCTILLAAEPSSSLSSQAIFGLQSHSWSSWDLTVQMTVRNRGFAGGADKLPIKTGWPDFFINRIIHLLEPGHDGFLKRDLLLHKSPIYHHPKVPLAMNHHSRVFAEISHGRTALQNIFAS